MWCSKKQVTSETATYGAAFIAAYTFMEQVVDICNLFQYLGIPVWQNSYVWGDNKSQVTSLVSPYARLNKRHNILSFHYVHNMVAQSFINLVDVGI